MLSADLVKEFLAHKSDPKLARPVGISGLRGYRSAIRFLFVKEKKRIPDWIEKDLTTFFAGLKRRDATERQEGSRKVMEGKQALSFSALRVISKACLQSLEGGNSAFLHLYMLLTWNLMCRSNNTSFITLNHLNWEGDALSVLFSKTKTDQGGERPQDPKHVYANPLIPEVCSILSLAVYFASTRIDFMDEELFPGGHQKDKFLRLFHSLMQFPKVRDELSAIGSPPSSELGSHSLRKGSSTYVCSGSVGGPSIVAVCLRCGWTLGGVQDRYFRYEAAGDYFVGLTVAGLPLSTAQFAVLPPHFLSDDEDVTRVLRNLYPGAWVRPHLRNILSMLAASLVFHSSFLRATLPEDHPLWQCYIFRDEEAFAVLKEKVIIDLMAPSTRFLPTGIPPHIDILCQLRKVLTAVDVVPGKVVEGVQSIVSRTASSAPISRCEMDVAMQSLIDRIESANERRDERMLASLQKGSGRHEAAGNQVHDATLSSRELSGKTYMWGGHFRRLPKDYRLPNATLQLGFFLWMRGNDSSGLPPLRRVSASDFSLKPMRKRFSEWRYVMKRCENLLEERDRTCTLPGENAVRQMWSTVARGINVGCETDKGHKRVRAHLQVTTLARLIRKQQVSRD